MDPRPAGRGRFFLVVVLNPAAEELWRRIVPRNTQPGETSIERATLDRYLHSTAAAYDHGRGAGYGPPLP